MDVRLRSGEDRDLEAVGALHERSRVAAYAGIVAMETPGGPPAGALSAWWAERWKWERETHRLAVAEVAGLIVGFTYVGPSETPDAAELYAIHVAPEHVGAGVGRALMIDALARLAGFGRPRAVLWVLEENHPARRFYERGGWRADGVSRVEPINDQPVPQLRYSRRLDV